MARGTVNAFDPDKGYGSIVPDKSKTELFVHESSVTTQDDPRLSVDQVVYFEVLDGKHGQQAIEVRPIKPTPTETTPA
jgi:cold shock CspA family protein